MDDTFEPRPLPVEPFGDSLGVNTGIPERIVIEFEPATARYIRAREWHRSQAIEDTADGGLVLTFHVCNDQPLHAWILGFGPAARVVSPASLVQQIFESADATRRRYMKTTPVESRFEMLSMKAG
jgi:predicted DNA-binding transcriptional regulator YafY